MRIYNTVEHIRGVAKGKGREVKCRNHPDREAVYLCQKYGVGYCQKCCACPNPETYCKFRSGCVIWEMCKDREGVLLDTKK